MSKSRFAPAKVPAANKVPEGAFERFGDFFSFVTLELRVERCTKSMSLTYELATEPLHISAE